MNINHQSRIIEDGAELTKLATGFQFTEGPVWFEDEQALYFSDIPASVTRRWTERDGIEVVWAPNDKANGMVRDRDGALLVCQHGTRRVVKWRGANDVEVVVDRYNDRRLNSPNDIVIRADNSIYFTDPPYGLTAEFGELGKAELPFQGVFRTDSERKELVLLDDSFDAPNGLAFSLDQSRLYINDSEKRHVRVFDVTESGNLNGGSIFAELIGDAAGVPDGMKVDSADNVHVTGPGGLWVFDRNGNHIETIPVPEVIGNFAFGGPEMKTIFFTASTSIYAIRTTVPGA